MILRQGRAARLSLLVHLHWPPVPRERFSRVPGMFGSLEVKVLYPT